MAASSPVRRRVTLDGVSATYDARVRAIRPDLADIALAELYFAPHYAAPVARTCVTTRTMVRSAPNALGNPISELLHGEAFHMLDARAGWAWGYCGYDHYVGYVPSEALGDPGSPITHVTTAAAPLFSAADIKSAILQLLPMGAQIVGAAEGDFIATGDGFVHVRHVRLMKAFESDWVAVAERALGMPYVWGGRGGLGYDCSGLLQTALAACDIIAPRDTDQQELALGEALPPAAELRRGDMVFFPGHVGLMVDGEKLIHANADWMAVTIEPLADVIARLKGSYEEPVTSRRRIVK